LGFCRQLVRLVTLVVTLAYLLPALLVIIPSPASAAEQALFADLQKSRCVDMNGDGVPDTGDAAHGGHDCCVLCAAPSSPPVRDVVSAEPITFVPPAATSAPRHQLNFAAAPAETVFQPLSSRGPPA
jgi:hypothetical protein